MCWRCVSTCLHIHLETKGQAVVVPEELSGVFCLHILRTRMANVTAAYMGAACNLSPQAWTSELCWLARLSSPCIHFLGFLFSRFFLYLFVCVCGHMCTCEHRVPWRLEEGICSFWARVVVSWQLPSMGDRSRTPVLWAISQPWEYFHHGSLSWCSCSVRIRIHIRTCSPGNLSTDPSSRHSVLRTRELSCLPASSFWLAQTYLKLNVSVLTHLSFYHKHFNPSGLWIGVCVSPTSPSLGAQGQTQADSVSDELSH